MEFLKAQFVAFLTHFHKNTANQSFFENIKNVISNFSHLSFLLVGMLKKGFPSAFMKFYKIAQFISGNAAYFWGRIMCK